MGEVVYLSVEADKVKVLYVDDEVKLLELGKIFLERSGEYSVGVCDNALDALELIEDGGYDIIISDYQMPVMDGIGFLKQIRGRGMDIPFIIFTGKGREEVVIEALNSGADFYVQKGGDPKPQFKELMGAMHHAVTLRRRERELDESKVLLARAGSIAHFGGWNVILDENRVVWSDEVARIHDMKEGYSPKIEEGISFYAPEWRDRIIRVFNECVENGKPYDEEMEIISGTGRRKWVRTLGEAVRDKSGKVVRVRGGFQDITPQKRTEQRMRQQNDVLRTLLEMYQLLDADDKSVLAKSLEAAMRVTQSAYSFIGSVIGDEQKVIIHHWSQSVLDECGIECKNRVFEVADSGLWGRCIRDRKPIVVNDFKLPENMLTTIPVGHVLMKSFMSVPIFNGKDIVAIIGVANKDEDYQIQDVESLVMLGNTMWGLVNAHRAKDAIAASEKACAMLFPHETIIFARLDMDGTLVHANPYLTEITSSSNGTAFCPEFLSLVHPEDAASLREAMDTCDERGSWLDARLGSHGEWVPFTVIVRLDSDCGLEKTLLVAGRRRDSC